MFKLGERQTLKCVSKAEFGIYLGENDKEKVLLPKKQVPEGMDVGDEIDVFIYRDSLDRLISTTSQPYISLGGMAILEVKSVSKIGAFLDWGLEKDLFLPFKEQTCMVNQGKSYLVYLYIDKSNRLAATMKVHKYLKPANKYQKDDMVSGIVYEINREIGAFVAVENEFYGLIPKKEMQKQIVVGDEILARVTEVREDGKLNLSPNKKAYMQMDVDAENILKVIEEYDGVLPYGEKVSPEIIARDFGLSKNAFKRGVGRLYKLGKIDIGENCIKIK
ncbi:MAG: S1 RNA-binding domain-containing protein [Lachnospiraceae bacterium]|nr:S1 RNA-binding domain-containing protein [Lachnospiraceae bacterium]